MNDLNDKSKREILGIKPNPAHFKTDRIEVWLKARQQMGEGYIKDLKEEHGIFETQRILDEEEQQGRRVQQPQSEHASSQSWQQPQPSSSPVRESKGPSINM